MLNQFIKFILPVFLISGSILNAQKLLTGKILFLNGDSLTADIVEWKEDNIRIKHPFLLNECVLDKANILEIKLLDNGSKELERDKVQDTTTIQIKPRYKSSNDNDTIRGNLVQNNAEAITLETNFAGELKIQRSKILNIDIDATTNLLYHGPNSLDEWHNTLHNSSWSFTNSSLYSSEDMGNISMDMKLPDQLLFSFDQHWRTSAYINIKLFSDDHKMSRPNNYYEFSVRHGSIYVRKFIDGRFMAMNALNKNFQNMQDLRRAMSVDKSAHYDLYLDKEKGIFHIFINGKLMNSYQDPDPKPDKFGTSVHLVSGDNSPMKINNIRVSRWSGNMPSNDDDKAFDKLKGEGQRILLKNGDAIIGKTGKINDGLMVIETEFGPLKLRVTGMRSIDLSDTPDDGPKMYKGDIKLYYKDGGWIIVKPVAMLGSKLKAFHQAFGEKEFDMNAFKRIDLHVYSEQHNRARKADSW